MHQWAKWAFPILITAVAIAWVVTGNQGQGGLIPVARGWNLLSGDHSQLQGYPMSDFLWAMVFLVGGWAGILVFLGVLVMAFIPWGFVVDEKRSLPWGTFALGFFVLIGFVVPGPGPILLGLVMLIPRLVQSGRVHFLWITQVVWILSAPFGWALGGLWWQQRKQYPKSWIAGMGLCLVGLVWDTWRFIHQSLDQMNGEGSFSWQLGLLLVMVLRCIWLTKAIQPQRQKRVLPWGAGLVAFALWVGLAGDKTVAVQNSGYFPQAAEIQAFAELFKARPELAFSPIITRSKWVWEKCQVTAGMRHCQLSGAIGPPLEGQPFVLVGDSKPRKAASAYLEEKKHWPTHRPLVFSGTVCLLGPSRNQGPNRRVQGLGVNKSAESVMAFAWFEGEQTEPSSHAEASLALQWAWKWAELALRENTRDGLAWGITGELILARNFLGANKTAPTPMEIEAWLAQAAYCFRKSLDLNPLDGKIAGVYAGVLRQVGALDLAQALPQFSKAGGTLAQGREATFLASGPTQVMDLKHMLEFRYPGDSDRSLARVKEAIALGLKGQALGELNRGRPERFGTEGAKLRMQLLIQCGFPEVALEVAGNHETMHRIFGLFEWPRTQGKGLGDHWKLPVLGWIKGMANLALFPHERTVNMFDSLIGDLSSDLAQIQLQMVQGVPFAVAKMALPIPQTPWAGRIESLKEWSNLESFAGLGSVLREEITALKRLQSGPIQP